MADIDSLSYNDTARTYGLSLGPIVVEAPRVNPSLKCADAYTNAGVMKGDGTYETLGQIYVMRCNNSLPIGSTVADFAKAHGLSKRSDLNSCPTMSSTIQPEAKTLLRAKGWVVSEHILASPSGLTLGFVGTDANRTVDITKSGPNELIIKIVECSGKTLGYKLNLDTEGLSEI